MVLHRLAVHRYTRSFFVGWIVTIAISADIALVWSEATGNYSGSLPIFGTFLLMIVFNIVVLGTSTLILQESNATVDSWLTKHLHIQSRHDIDLEATSEKVIATYDRLFYHCRAYADRIVVSSLQDKTTVHYGEITGWSRTGSKLAVGYSKDDQRGLLIVLAFGWNFEKAREFESILSECVQR